MHRTRATRELGHCRPGGAASRRSRARSSSATPARVRDRRVLRVDDVYTTGATFSECSDALLAAGAAAVHVLALARAV